jgi:hypothetical protein
MSEDSSPRVTSCYRPWGKQGENRGKQGQTDISHISKSFPERSERRRELDYLFFPRESLEMGGVGDRKRFLGLRRKMACAHLLRFAGQGSNLRNVRLSRIPPSRIPPGFPLTELSGSLPSYFRSFHRRTVAFDVVTRGSSPR